MLESAGALLQERQVMQRVEDILVALITASVAGDDVLQIEDIHPKRIGFEHQVELSLVGRHRVTVGFELNLAVGRQADRPGHAALVVPAWQPQQRRPFQFPGFADDHRLAVYLSLIIFQALGQEQRVEFRKRGHFRDGYHEVTPPKTYAMLDATLFIAFARRAEMAREQVMAAQGDERLLLLPGVPLQDLLHGRLEVIVGEALRDTLKMVKCLDVPFEEGFLLLGREGHHEELARVTKPHVEDLDRDPLAGALDQRFAPIDLGIRARAELQRQVHLGPALLPPSLADVTPHRRLAALVAVLLDLFVNLVAGITLFLRRVLVLGQQILDALLVRIEQRSRAGLAQRIRLSLGRADGLAYGLAGDMQICSNLPQALLVDEVRPPDLFTVFHSDHPSPPRHGRWPAHDNGDCSDGSLFDCQNATKWFPFRALPHFDIGGESVAHLRQAVFAA